MRITTDSWRVKRVANFIALPNSLHLFLSFFLIIKIFRQSPIFSHFTKITLLHHDANMATFVVLRHPVRKLCEWERAA